MRYAIIEDDKVVNIALADEPIENNWIASDVAQIGQIYENGEFKDAPLNYDAQWAAVRYLRDAKLAASDWTQLPDTPTDKPTWAAYRQELRDVTSQDDPFAIVWPTEPA